MRSRSRDAILRRLRNTRASVHVAPQRGRPAVPVVARPLDECSSRFQLEAAALGMDCFVEDSPEGVRARLIEVIAGRRVLAWDPEQLPYDAGVALDGHLTGRARRDAQAAAEVGVTGCDAAIAETASLVLLSAPGRSRLASLLPPSHVALVRRDQLCFTMGEFFDRSVASLRQSASCTFVTGPSRTADIELTLTLGIHGPGTVTVIVGP